MDNVGLDYDSAREATPRWYGVSSGNGNDGVSHTYPDYFVRTCDPWKLASAALLSQFTADGMAWAHDVMESDGEADYTISAVVYDPPDDESDEDGKSWSSVNGAWLIVEVFPVELEDREISLQPEYDSLRDCFTADVLALAD